MSKNNNVELIGNIGAKARIITNTKSPFAAFSIATKDSYKDKDGNWKDKEAAWHDVITFNPKLIEQAKGIETKDRIKVTGFLTYRFFDAVEQGDKTSKKRVVSIVAEKIESAPLKLNNE